MQGGLVNIFRVMSMINNPKNSNTEKSNKNHLRKKSQSGSLKKALASLQVNQRVSKNTQGGKTDIQRPPMNGGFFISALPSGAYNGQSGGRKYKISSGQYSCSAGKMRGVTLCTFRNTRQFYCHFLRNIQGLPL